MEADWEVEIGGGAPVIEADWSAFVDLRNHPDRLREIEEAAAFPPLAKLLLALNAPESPLWTSKCDLWEPEPAALAAYIDILPRKGILYREREQAKAFCREYVGRLAAIALPQCGSGRQPDVSIDLVIRQAVAGGADGFGITAYLSAKAADRQGAEMALASVMAGFADALPSRKPPAMADSQIQ
jgi:hypothetical protein